MELSTMFDLIQAILTFAAIMIARQAVKLSQKWAEITLNYQHNKMLREHFLEHIENLSKISDRYRSELHKRQQSCMEQKHNMLIYNDFYYIAFNIILD